MIQGIKEFTQEKSTLIIKKTQIIRRYTDGLSPEDFPISLKDNPDLKEIEQPMGNDRRPPPVSFNLWQPLGPYYFLLSHLFFRTTF